MPPTPSSRSRSASSTRSPICAKRSAPTSRTCRAASGSTIASAPKFLHAGPGYGGSCFPKDTLALLRTADEAGVAQRIVSTVVEVNDQRKEAMAARVAAALGGSLAGKRIAVLGLAFKPNTDDMRDAPSLPLIRGLLRGRRERRRVRPGRDASRREPLLPAIEFARRRPCRRRGCRRAGDRDRVGRVPRARPGRARRGRCAATPGRPAQRLRPRRGRARRPGSFRHRPGRGGSATQRIGPRRIIAMSDIGRDRRRRARLCRAAAGGRAGRASSRSSASISTRSASPSCRRGHDRTREIDGEELARHQPALDRPTPRIAAAPTSTSSPCRRRSTPPTGPTSAR